MKTRHIGLIGAALLAVFLAALIAADQKDDQAELALRAAIKTETVDGDLRGAIGQYNKIIAMPGAGRPTVAKALLRMGLCYEKLGNAEAAKAYERVVREFSDQKEMVAMAQARLAALGPGPGATPAVTVRQVWAGPDVDTYGAPFRDGSNLTFGTGSGDLGIRDLATGKIRQVTKNQGVLSQYVYSSIPSPDGKQVAFSWYNADGFCDLRIVDLDGSEPRILYSNAEVEWLYPADWSPDGDSILAIFPRKEGDQMVLVSAVDGSVRVLKTLEGDYLERPRFSPDGRYIAYALPQRPESEEHDIFVLALDDGREIPLVQHPANDVDPDWTPDGQRILFLSNRTGTMGACWIQVAEGKPRGTPELVKPDLGQDLTAMGFTRNGSYYYGVHTEMSDVYIAELDLTTGKLISAPSAATQRFWGSNNRPDWSPDGRQLLFLSKRGPGAWGARAICVRSTEGGEVRELPSKLNRLSFARWSPDARSLLVAAAHQGFGLFRIDIQTGDFIAGPKPPGLIGWSPAVSRDGKMFYQAAFNKPTRTCIMVWDLVTGDDKVLYSAPDSSYFASGAAISPDGRLLAFAEGTNPENPSTVIKVMATAGGEARDLLRGVQLPWSASIAWAPDGASLVFARKPSPPNSKTELWLISVQGGEPRKLDLAAEGMRDVCLHPDGRHIAFTSVQRTSEVWVLENFLPGAKPAK